MQWVQVLRALAHAPLHTAEWVGQAFCEATHAVRCSRLHADQRTLPAAVETAAHVQRFVLVGRQASSQLCQRQQGGPTLLAVTAA